MPQYDVGDRVKLTLNVTEAGAPVDPTSVKLIVRAPTADGGPEDTTYFFGTGNTITKTATGSYEAIVKPAIGGEWKYRWETTGNGEGAEQGAFTVKRKWVG